MANPSTHDSQVFLGIPLWNHRKCYFPSPCTAFGSWQAAKYWQSCGNPYPPTQWKLMGEYIELVANQIASWFALVTRFCGARVHRNLEANAHGSLKLRSWGCPNFLFKERAFRSYQEFCKDMVARSMFLPEKAFLVFCQGPWRHRMASEWFLQLLTQWTACALCLACSVPSGSM